MIWPRLNIITEGQTEEEFARGPLARFLAECRIHVQARSVLTSRKKGRNFRGGLHDYWQAKRDIQRWMKEDGGSGVTFTTMIDLYALPNDFPGMSSASKIKDAYKRVAFLEDAFAKEIAAPNFIPYIQLHEFEALIFAASEEMIYMFENAEQKVAAMKGITAQHEGNPELINDKPETAPSKRIMALFPEYSKVDHAQELLRSVKIPHLQTTCPHFGQWVDKLIALSPA